MFFAGLHFGAKAVSKFSSYKEKIFKGYMRDSSYLFDISLSARCINEIGIYCRVFVASQVIRNQDNGLGNPNLLWILLRFL